MKRTQFKRPTLAQVKAKQALKRQKTPLKRKQKPKVIPISKLKKQLWDECRRITRKRFNCDGEYYCFTCGNLVAVPHTGHIIASSLSSAEMRYSLDNLRLQCYMCNIYKSGNWVGFYEVLGKDYIDDLIKRNNESKGKSYHTDWYLNKIEEYKKL